MTNANKDEDDYCESFYDQDISRNWLYLLLQEDSMNDFIYWGKFADTDKGRLSIQNIVRSGVPYIIVKGSETGL